MDWWTEALQVAAAESSSGIIGKVRIEFGYKVYVSGAPQAETFFPASARLADTEDRARALAEARAYAQKAGQPQRPKWSLQIRIFRDTAVSSGEPVTWKDDRFFVVATFADAFEVVARSIQEAGIMELPWEGWARVRLINDPYFEKQGEAGKVDRDADGNPTFPRIALIREVFPDENTARAAALGETRELLPQSPSVPPGYTPATWALVVPEIQKAVSNGKSIQQVATEYGVGEDWVEHVIGEIPY